MKLAKSYNKIAHSYDEHADAFNLLTSSRFSAKQQIESYFGEARDDKSVLDIGVGSGIFLSELEAEVFNVAHFVGLDISESMLKIARDNLPKLRTLCGTVDHIARDLQGEYYDLIVAHFVLAYVDLGQFLQKTSPCLKDDGVISVVTTTYESFPAFQDNIKYLVAQGSAWSPLFKNLYQSAIKRTLTPLSYADIEKTAQAAGFTVMQHQHLETTIKFDTPKKLVDFAVKGGWLLNAFDCRWMPVTFWYYLMRLLCKGYFRFPYEDQHVVEVVLLKKG